MEMTREDIASNEACLIEEIIRGRKELYEIIIRKYNPYLYKIGRSYQYNHADTEDLMQDTFIDAYRNLNQFRGRSSFKTWITRIMLNNCYHQKRKSSYKNEIPRELYEESKPMYANTNDQTGRVVRSHELRHIVEEALMQLPLPYRMVFSLREMNQINVAETASLLDISEANVKVRLSRAKAMLREHIEKSYSPTDLFEFNLIHCDPMVERVMQEIKK